MEAVADEAGGLVVPPYEAYEAYEAYERYEAPARQRERLDRALSAAPSVQVELPGPFSPEHDREIAGNVDGEISAAELYRRAVARYRRP